MRTNDALLPQTQGPLKTVSGLAYAAPALALGFLMASLAILQGLYAKYFGLELSVIASILLISRLFDAISDPLIGYASDRYRITGGGRKPFVVAGGVLLMITSWFLFIPPANVSGTYFLFWFLAFYFAATLFDIPHLTWGGELAISSREKNTVYGQRTFFLFVGVLAFFALPLLPIFKSGEFTPETLKWSVLAACVFMIPALFVCVKIAPDATRSLIRDHHTKECVRTIAQAVLSNKPFLILTASHICTGFGWGVWFTLLFFFVDGFLGVGDRFALVYALSYGSSLLFLRPWAMLANRRGKQFTWRAGMCMSAMGLSGFGLLTPGDNAWILLLGCMTLIFGGLVAFNIIVPSLISDIADYGTWRSRADRSATYFSIYAFINKTVAALGGALGLAIIDWSGFEPKATAHSDVAVMGLHLATVWIPASFFLLSIFLIGRIPITAHQHAVIRKRLSSRGKTRRANDLSPGNVKAKKLAMQELKQPIKKPLSSLNQT